MSKITTNRVYRKLVVRGRLRSLIGWLPAVILPDGDCGTTPGPAGRRLSGGRQRPDVGTVHARECGRVFSWAPPRRPWYGFR